MSRGPKKSEAYAALLVLGILGGFSILLWQTWSWLKSGVWPKLTLGTLLMSTVHGTDFDLWLTHPNSWYGLHTLVAYLVQLPLWIWAVACGLVFSWVTED